MSVRTRSASSASCLLSEQISELSRKDTDFILQALDGRGCLRAIDQLELEFQRRDQRERDTGAILPVRSAVIVDRSQRRTCRWGSRWSVSR